MPVNQGFFEIINHFRVKYTVALHFDFIKKQYLYVQNKLPNCREAVGESMLDIQIYLDVMEIVHSAAGGEGVKVLFCVLNRYGERSKLPVIP